jgi:hypothetical protein
MLPDYRIGSTQKPNYLYQELQFGRSARLSNLIVGVLVLCSGCGSLECLPPSVKAKSSEGRFRSRCRAFVEETAITEFL